MGTTDSGSTRRAFPSHGTRGRAIGDEDSAAGAGLGLLVLAGLQPQEAPSHYAAMVTKLPNAGNAVVEVRKLRDYVLSTEHPRDKHKARVFASTVGLIVDDAEELREALLSAAVAEEAMPDAEDEYGRRYVLDFTLNTETGPLRYGADGSSAPTRTSRDYDVPGSAGIEMEESIDITDVVALTEDLPTRGLRRGQVGTVVESLAPGVFEVEFSDDEGRGYASSALRADQLLILHYEPV